MQLVSIKELNGIIVLRSGLHIGAGDTDMHIGGTDNPIIKHPHSLEPYIPGSSLKGKIRSLLEMKSGLMDITGGKPVQATDLKKCKTDSQKKECENILKIFGTSGADADENTELGPTRVSFSDCSLTTEWRSKSRQERLSLVEVKSENSINRIKGTAESPRFTERVPAGAKFEFTVSLKMLGQENALLDYLLEGLKLLEMDALGGSGSRGYGRIRFEFTDEDIKKQFDAIDPFAKGGSQS